MANASVQDGQSAPPPTAPPAVNKRPLASPSTAPGQETAKRNEVYISPEMGLLDRIRSGSGGNPGQNGSEPGRSGAPQLSILDPTLPLAGEDDRAHQDIDLSMIPVQQTQEGPPSFNQLSEQDVIARAALGVPAEPNQLSVNTDEYDSEDLLAYSPSQDGAPRGLPEDEGGDNHQPDAGPQGAPSEDDEPPRDPTMSPHSSQDEDEETGDWSIPKVEPETLAPPPKKFPIEITFRPPPYEFDRKGKVIRVQLDDPSSMAFKFASKMEILTAIGHDPKDHFELTLKGVFGRAGRQLATYHYLFSRRRYVKFLLENDLPPIKKYQVAVRDLMGTPNTATFEFRAIVDPNKGPAALSQTRDVLVDCGLDPESLRGGVEVKTNATAVGKQATSFNQIMVSGNYCTNHGSQQPAMVVGPDAVPVQKTIHFNGKDIPVPQNPILDPISQFVFEDSNGFINHHKIEKVDHCKYCWGPRHPQARGKGAKPFMCIYFNFCRMCLQYLPALPHKGHKHACNAGILAMPKPKRYAPAYQAPKPNHNVVAKREPTRSVDSQSKRQRMLERMQKATGPPGL